MKSLLLAAAFAFAPAAAQAAVTINFTGATLPSENDTDAGGSYVETITPDGSVIKAETVAQAVSGSIVIDTSKIGPNTGTDPDVSYSGEDFVTLTFTSTGVTPTILKGSLGKQTIDSAGGGLSFSLFDEADTYAYTFQLFSFNAIPTSIFDGILLPDFANADGLFFSAISVEQDGDTLTRRVSAGSVSTITQAVPEPATWAMMLVGFGLVGTALRRRERVSVRFA